MPGFVDAFGPFLPAGDTLLLLHFLRLLLFSAGDFQPGKVYITEEGVSRIPSYYQRIRHDTPYTARV
jgi:hypothetical protein